MRLSLTRVEKRNPDALYAPKCCVRCDRSVVSWNSRGSATQDGSIESPSIASRSFGPRPVKRSERNVRVSQHVVCKQKENKKSSYQPRYFSFVSFFRANYPAKNSDQKSRSASRFDSRPASKPNVAKMRRRWRTHNFHARTHIHPQTRTHVTSLSITYRATAVKDFYVTHKSYHSRRMPAGPPRAPPCGSLSQ